MTKRNCLVGSKPRHALPRTESHGSHRKGVRTGSLAAILFGLLACCLGMSGGATSALWSFEQHTDVLDAELAAVGFHVDEMTDASDHTTIDHAAGTDTDTNRVAVHAEDFAMMPGHPGTRVLASPFTTTMLVSGGYGMSFTVDVAAFGGFPRDALEEDPVVFPVDNAQQCTADAVMALSNNGHHGHDIVVYGIGDTIPGVAPTRGTTSPMVVNQQWCVGAVTHTQHVDRSVTVSYTQFTAGRSDGNSGPSSHASHVTVAWGATLSPTLGSGGLLFTFTPRLIE